MATSSAWWYNPNSNECFVVLGTHNDWLKYEPNATKLGVSPLMRKFIGTTDDIDEIRLAAVIEGMVRIRDYHHKVSIQFMARLGTREVVRKIYHCLSDKLRMESWLVIQNVLSQETHEIGLLELGKRLEDPSFQLFQDGLSSFSDEVSVGFKIKKLVEWMSHQPSASKSTVDG